MNILEGIENKQHRKWNEKEISTLALQINSKKWIGRKLVQKKNQGKRNKQKERKGTSVCMRAHVACRYPLKQLCMQPYATRSIHSTIWLQIINSQRRKKQRTMSGNEYKKE